MSDLVFAGAQPAYIQQRQEQAAANNAAISAGLPQGGGLPRLSIRGSKWRVVIGEDEQVLPSPEIHVVIITAREAVSKRWYSKQYDPNAVDAAEPDCFSLDGVRPHRDAQNKQHSSCELCPLNAWGSDPKGGKGKACSDYKRIVVIPCSPDGTLAKVGGEYQAFKLDLPATSLKNMRTYVKLCDGHNVDITTVVTKITLDQDSTWPVMEFAPGGAYLPEDQFNITQEQVQDELVREAVDVTAPVPTQQVQEEPVTPDANPFGEPGTPAPQPDVAPTTQPTPDLLQGDDRASSSGWDAAKEFGTDPVSDLRDESNRQSDPEPASSDSTDPFDVDEDTDLEVLRDLATRLGHPDPEKRRSSTLIRFITENRGKPLSDAPATDTAEQEASGVDIDADLKAQLEQELGAWATGNGDNA